MNTLTISALLTVFVSAAFAIVISTKSLKDERYRWFAIFCLLISVWTLHFFLAHLFQTKLFDRLYLLFTLFLGPCIIHFFDKFLIKPKTISKLSLTATFFSGFLALGIFLPSKQLFQYSYMVVTYTCLLVLYAFLKQILSLKHPHLSSYERRRRTYWIISGIITFIALILNEFSQTNWAVPPMGYVFLILYLYFVYQTITKQRVLDLEDLMAKGILFFVLAAILTLIYAVLVSWVKGPSLFIFNTFVASFVILILFEPIKSFIEQTIYELFLKSRIKTEQKLDQIIHTLRETTDIRDLSHSVVVGLKDIFNATQAHFFLLDREGIKFKLINSLELDPSKLKVNDIPIHHHFVKYIQKIFPRAANAYSIGREILEGGRTTPKERLEDSLQILKVLNAEVAFAFIIDGKMLGFSSFINEKAEAGYSLNELTLLEPLSKQIALSLKNLEIYDQIRQRDRLATVGEMAAGLAHEIRNPLGAIKGAAQYLYPSQDQPQQNEFLKIIVDEVNRLDKVVASFLNYAKPLEQNLVQTDLAQLIRETLQALMLHQPIKLHTTTHFDTKAPFLLVDPTQMKQVFINLSLNAIQAMPEGGTLHVSLENLKEHLQIIFHDSGVGMTLEDQKKLFIPFYTTREGGSGLGLPICQKIIRAHRGTIRIESELRKGSKFIITLPHKIS